MSASKKKNLNNPRVSRISDSPAVSSAFEPAAEHFKTLFENSPGLFLVLDADLRIVAVTDAYLRATMTERDQILGKELFRVFPDNPDDPLASGVRNLGASLRRARMSRQADTMAVQKYDIRRPDGTFEERYWSPINSPIFDRDGQFLYYLHRVEDVTEVVRLASAGERDRRAHEEELAHKSKELEVISELLKKERESLRVLHESEEQLRTLADSIPQLAWIARADGYIFWYNRRWYEYTGTTPEQMEGWGWQSVHDPARLPGVLQRWKMSIETGQPFDMEFPLRGAGGSFRWFLTRVVPVRDDDGRVIRWFGTNTDVDELKRMQDALRDSEGRLRVSEERLRLAQKAAKIGSWELDLDRDEYIWSQEVLEMFGYPPLPERPTHSDLLRLMYVSTDRENATRAMKKALNRNREYETQFRIRRGDGECRWIAARGKPFYNLGKQFLLGVFIDITEAQKAIQEAEA